MLGLISEIFDDFLSLLFPSLCAGCSEPLVKGEEILCLKCIADLPITGFESYMDNPVAKIFWGRVDIEFATTFCFFEKGNRIQAVLHKLKYKGDWEVGVFLGKYYANELIRGGKFDDIDIVVPVPLHPQKLKKRGYNQSEGIAKGMSETFNKAMEAGNLFRKQSTGTQTQKSRYGRWENVESAFGIKQPEMFTNKHLLLVDDIVTTGATLEACCSVLSEIEGVKISIATIACA